MVDKQSCSLIVAAVMAIPGLARGAATNVWAGTGSWTNPAGWSLGHVPADGESVRVQGVVSLDRSTAALASYRLASGSVQTCLGWNTVLRASDVLVEGVLEHAANTASATNGEGLWMPDNRIQVACVNFTVGSGGTISAVERGYQGGWGSADGRGPGGSMHVVTAQDAAGADHAGIGGKSFGRTYGDRVHPEQPGSGAGGWSGAAGHGGHGGGVIHVEASNTVRVEGTIRADGGDSFNQSGVSGGGSGGSIAIACSRFEGSTGMISANGGNAGTHVWTPGGGGGGRIALRCSQEASSGITFSVQGGTSRSNAWNGGAGTVCKMVKPATSHPTGAMIVISGAPPRLAMNLNVLVIGDSNTELGHITGEMARLFEQRYGNYGSGYHSALASVGMGGGYLPGLSITNIGTWRLYRMVEGGTHEAIPYLAPDGAAVISSSPGARTVVSFIGTNLDLYWLASATGGTFSARMDGGPAQEVATVSATQDVGRTRWAGLSPGTHTLEVAVVSGPVMLLGVEAVNEVRDSVAGRRAVVHKWGRSWATTRDYVAVDASVHAAALRLLAPNVVVLLLGTNDHNLSPFTPKDQFRDNEIVLVRRIRNALPGALVLVLTPNQIQEFAGNNDRLREYVAVMPQVVAETGAVYWSMTGWFGPWADNQAAGLFLDNLHMNREGGARIAARLIEVIASELQARDQEGTH